MLVVRLLVFGLLLAPGNASFDAGAACSAFAEYAGKNSGTGALTYAAPFASAD